MTDLTPDLVLDELQPIFREALDSPHITITRTSSALNTPNWDSLAHIEIIEMTEHRFKVKFALGELHNLREVADLIDLILAKSKA